MSRKPVVGVFIEPLQALRLHGAGERAARSQGPGAIPGEEPLLPRLETLVGFLASLAYRKGVAGHCKRNDWCSCSLDPAARLLECRDQGYARLLGPFLVAGSSSEDARVFVNVSTGLLDVDALEAWIEAARLLEDAAGEPLPLARSTERKRAFELIHNLVEEKYLIPWRMLMQRFTGIALQPRAKAAEHGLIYTYSAVNIHKVVIRDKIYRPWIVLVAAGCYGPENSEDSLASLGPRSAPVVFTTRRLTDVGEGDEPPYIVLSNAPLWQSIGYAIHPLPPGSGLEVYARAYHTEYSSTGFRKDRPQAALWPGTILWDEPVNEACTHPCNNMPSLCHVLGVNTVKRLADILKTQGALAPASL